MDIWINLKKPEEVRKCPQAITINCLTLYNDNTFGSNPWEYTSHFNDIPPLRSSSQAAPQSQVSPTPNHPPHQVVESLILLFVSFDFFGLWLLNKQPEKITLIDQFIPCLMKSFFVMLTSSSGGQSSQESFWVNIICFQFFLSLLEKKENIFLVCFFFIIAVLIWSVI